MKTDQKATNRDENSHSDLMDQILSTDGRIVPASGFADSVMEAIAVREASPQPMRFPWKLAVPGMAGIAATIVTAVRLVIQTAVQKPVPGQLEWPALMQTQAVRDILSSPNLRLVAGPLLLALIASYGALWMAKKMAGESASS